MIVGGYVLHVYCDFEDDSYKHRGGESSQGFGFGEFSGDTKREAYQVARQYGWYFSKGGQCLCGWCASQGRALR